MSHSKFVNKKSRIMVNNRFNVSCYMDEVDEFFKIFIGLLLSMY